MVIELSFEIKIPRSLRGRTPQKIISDEARLGVKRISTIMLKTVRKAVDSVTGGTNRGWQRIPVRRRGNSIEGGVVNKAKGGQNRRTGVSAQVAENGTQKHPFPPVTKTAEPALAEWLRRGRFGNFIAEATTGKATTIRPANLSSKRDLNKLAFIIGRSISRRGLPRPGKKKKAYTRALKRKDPAFRKEIDIIGQRIVKKFG